MGAVTFSIDPELIASLRGALQLRLFVETGTFHGDSVAANQELFDRLISIEVSEDLWRAATQRFTQMPQIEIVQGSSPDVLDALHTRFANISTLFWLDAHWCVAENAAGQTSQCPLLDELRAIKSLRRDSVVLIDDARLFLAPPPAPHDIAQWPTFADVLAELNRLSPAHEVAVINDVIIFHPRSIRNVVEEYGRKHGIDWLHARQAQNEAHRTRHEMEAKEGVISELKSALAAAEASCLLLEREITEKEAMIRQLDCARNEQLLRADGWLADSKEKQAVIFSLRDHAEAADERSRELREGIEEKERHLQALHGELATHQERYLEAIRIMEEKEKVITELSGAIAQRDASLGSVESVVARYAASIHAALRDNADALARAEDRQRDMLASMRDTRESLRELLGGKEDARAQVGKPSDSPRVQQVLLAALEEKEQVIQELRGALDAYRASYPLLAFLGRPVRWIQMLRKRAAASVSGMLRPRLGNLNQHAPIELRLPTHYGCESPPEQPPRISIVTPSYRQAGFIERTIASVLDQKYPNLEYFVQDGGSDDGTCEILQRYSARLDGWHSQRDGGQSQAINLGFAKTTGDIMAWLNSDDLLLPGSLAYVAAYLEKHPEVDVVYGHRILIDESDRQIGRWIMPAHDDEVLSWADFVPQETLFWRRRIWDKVGGKIDESFRFAMDWDLLVRFRDAGAKFARLPRAIGAFRIHTQQKTSAVISEVGFEEMDRIRLRALGERPTGSQIRAAITPYLMRHMLTDWGWRLRRLSGGLREFTVGKPGS